MGLEDGTSRYKDVESEEPLLGKSELIGSRYQTQPDALLSSRDDDPSAPSFGYNVGARPVQDLVFAIIFLLLMLVVTFFGIYGILNANPNFHNPNLTCTMSAKWEMKRVTKTSLTAIILGITLALSGPLALGFLYLLRIHTSFLVHATLPFTVLLPGTVNLTWFIVCQRHIECRTEVDGSGQYLAFGSIFLLCALTAYILYSNRDRIELTTRVVKAAAEALHQNLALLLALPCLSLALVAFCVLPVGTFMWYASANGKVGEESCAWEPAPWVPYYLSLSGFAVVWASMIVAQVQVLTISGTISQWYFAQAGSHSPLHATKRALRVAFGPSFGTACLAGLVVAFLRVIRGAFNKEDDDRAHEGGTLAVFLRACLHWVVEAVEFFTRFTSNFAAIRGESFYTSAVMAHNLLKRNLLSTVLVEVISDRLLIMVAFVLSVAYAVLVYTMLSLFTDLARDERLVEAVLGWLVVFSVLVLLVRVVSNVVDTVYICYAMDREQGVSSKPQVHDVLVLLPASRDDNLSLAVRREH